MVATSEKLVFDDVPLYPSVVKGLNPTSSIHSVTDSLSKYVSGGKIPGNQSHQVDILDLLPKWMRSALNETNPGFFRFANLNVLKMI